MRAFERAMERMPSSGPDKGCADFATQAEAQRYLLPGDPHGLDADHDGMACDSLA
jgi:Excalibur calcium-binding domain